MSIREQKLRKSLEEMNNRFFLSDLDYLIKRSGISRYKITTNYVIEGSTLKLSINKKVFQSKNKFNRKLNLFKHYLAAKIPASVLLVINNEIVIYQP